MALGSSTANGAWLTWSRSTRAAGALPSVFHAKATTATIPAQLIAVLAGLARSARRVVVNLHKDWPWQHGREAIFAAATGPAGPQGTQPQDHQLKGLLPSRVDPPCGTGSLRVRLAAVPTVASDR